MFPENFIHTVSHSPGVYLMLDSKSVVIYVGKAKDLRKRLSSYARFSGSEHNKTTVMLSKVSTVDTLITNTEKEALILEASLIKKHKPRYNIILRDDKNYPFIKVTVQEEWPRVMMSRRKKKEKARYFGPYSSSSAMWATIKLLHSLFPLRRCKDYSVKQRNRPCLNKQMQHCLAPCVGLADQQAYQNMVNSVIMLLEGRSSELVARLTKEMQQAAAAQEFEQAVVHRDQINALKQTLEKQIVVSNHTRDHDVFGFVRHDAAVAIAILHVRNGQVSGSRTFLLADPYGDNAAILSQALSQYYDQAGKLPGKILLPFTPADHHLLNDYFTEMRQAKTSLYIPKRGERKQLIAMACANAEQIFAEQDKKERSWEILSSAMVKKLHLDRVPHTIECLDISNISGKQAVGSLVCFQQGLKAAKRYRHYKIKTVSGPDDYAMMAEVLERRLSRGLAEDTLPDLFVVDGGRGQLGMAIRVAKQLGLEQQIDWLGIAKEKKEEGEKLYKPGRKNPIILPHHNPILLYLMRIRDESHRFGVTFHRSLRQKATLSSRMDSIPGIGPGRRKKLLRKLGSMKRIEAASLEQLEEVPGIGKELASEIFSFFHKNKDKKERNE